jgi:uncharacterized membrane protein YoaT (DUF817 family)
MYAAVASYMMQAWRHLKLRLSGSPPQVLAVALCVLTYANFFANHFIPDLRWPLALGVLIAFWRTWVHFTPLRDERRMPLLLSFALIGFFVWLAENIGTYFGAWVYPNQLKAWAIVGPGKISSWGLLVILSFIIVAALKRNTGRSSASVTRGSPSGIHLAAPQ